MNWTTLRYAVVDVECNSHHPPDLAELAIVPIIDGVIGEPVAWMVRPDQPITAMARRIHGISNESVAHADTFADVRASVRAQLDVDAIVAHAAHVEVGVLQRKLGDWDCPEVFDTLTLARRLLPGRPSYSLGRLVEEFPLDSGLPDNMKPHRADYDATVCARLFAHLAERHSLDELRDQAPRGEQDGPATLF